MNRAQVAARLAREGAPDALYDIPGVHPVPIQLDAFYVLLPDPGGGWLVVLRQRGQDAVLGRYATEAAACARLYDLVTELPAPPPGGAERVARLLADSAKIQRQAWQDYDDAPPPDGD
ncbi:hypothetical protein [Streptomyces sp. NBC_01198]|uniref:hypothetical protein n=1 Tax=Streptomyces sp. NBC_01198 TaxID=2903769 RepID=UPI002E0E30DF|nr:hypothetical protein OG702_21515 [Streptomyces sp. NBC_01198]